jgi:hypothetical protein
MKKKRLRNTVTDTPDLMTALEASLVRWVENLPPKNPSQQNRPEPCTCPASNPANEMYGECPREQECYENWLNRHQGEEGLDLSPERSL